MTGKPTESTALPDCLESCVCRDGDKITVEFNNPEPRKDDWIGIVSFFDDGQIWKPRLLLSLTHSLFLSTNARTML